MAIEDENLLTPEQFPERNLASVAAEYLMTAISAMEDLRGVWRESPHGPDGRDIQNRIKGIDIDMTRLLINILETRH